MIVIRHHPTRIVRYGLNYTLSLPHNSRALTGKCDFDKMEGLEGHYVANYVDNVK